MGAPLSPQQCATVESLWLDAESHRAAELLLRRLPDKTQFPRDLAVLATLTFPIQIKKIPALTVANANHWFLARGSDRAFAGENRPLHGCCFTDKGNCTIFVDANDDADEQRFTIAHEISHFLLDHYLPRQNALAAFGSEILAVLDGMRKPTIAERFRSALIQLPIGATTDLMVRARDPHIAYQVTSVENRADRLALALLAPAASVLADLPDTLYDNQRAELLVRLREGFGLPAAVADRYADALLLPLGRTPSRFVWSARQ